jgi:enediyne biosynthesis protein E4
MAKLIRALPLVLLLGAGCGRDVSEPSTTTAGPPRDWVQAREDKVDQTIWAKEMLAQECGRVFESLWDSLNASTNALKLVASFPAAAFQLGRWDGRELLPHSIELRKSAGVGAVLGQREWRVLVEKFQRDGWQLSQSEFRHRRLDLNEAGQPRQSSFYFSAHLTNAVRTVRAALEGDLVVEWAPPQAGQAPVVQRIDAAELTLTAREGPPLFQKVFEEAFDTTDIPWIDPLMARDLDGDGIPEIILLAKNLVYRRAVDGGYRSQELCKQPVATLVFTGVISDFDGDGRADLLCATTAGLSLFRGSGSAAFEQASQPVWEAKPRLENPMALTCGDIDGDGDLDVFLGQYRVPTLGQIFRPSYYDANDGHPACLLLNDGHGRFTQGTAAAGLEKKRWRRVFSASFVDLDADGDLDLLVVSDFAGADIYRNDGQGRFTDVTAAWISDRHAFGMSHAFADFDVNGELDFLMIGMNSPTTDRLDHLRLNRSGAPEEQVMRTRMSYGNRLYLARGTEGFVQTALNDSMARSGWSWGCSAFEWDNDGFPDLYIGNGQETRRTVREYEPEFWLHNLFVDASIDDVSATAYFIRQFERRRNEGWSYGGYEKNRLFWNRSALEFLDVGHLANMGLEDDSRGVVSADLNADGRMDLLLTTIERWPATTHSLRVYENRLPDPGHWIGFQLEAGPRRPSVGATAVVRHGSRTAVGTVVTGDSSRGQHPSVIHVGLGQAETVDSVEIRWPGGRVTKMDGPAINRYYRLAAPE